MPYPDLSTMYQNGMGATASLMGGQMASTAQAQDAEKLKQMQLETAQSATMNPLNAQFKQGQIAQQGAELPGIQGQSASLVARGNEDMQTMASNIAAKLSSAATRIGNDGMVQMGQDGEKLSHAAAIIANYPPALQKQMFLKAIQQYGGNVQSPMFQALMQAPDEGFQKAASTLGSGMALAGQKYAQESATAATHMQGQKDIAEGHDKTSVRVAEITAASREAAAKARAGAVKHMTTDQQIAFLTGIPVGDRTEAEQAQLIAISKQRIAEKTATANAVTPTIVGQKTNQQIGNETAENIHGSTNTQHSQPDIATAAKAQWGGEYDPATYDYRMSNGVALRKKK